MGDDQNYPTLTITTEKTDGTSGDVEVRFYPGKGLNVGMAGQYLWEKYYGALNARGTQQHRIIFTADDNSTEQDYWRGLFFNSTTVTSPTILEYCSFKYGGNGQQGIIKCRSSVDLNSSIIQSGITSGIYVENADPDIDNCTVRQNSENGIFVYSCRGSVNGEIKNCTIEENATHGIKLETCHPSYVCHPAIKNNKIEKNMAYGLFCNDVQCNPLVEANRFIENRSFPLRISFLMYVDGYSLTADNVFHGNACQAIEVTGGGVTAGDKIRWRNMGIPYIIKEGDIKFAHSTLGRAMLIIDAGTTVKFDPGLELVMGGGSIYSKQYGYLRAKGTKDNPVTFTASQPGRYWKGISFYHDKTLWGSWLHNCIIEYGGGEKDGSYDREANVYFWECKPSFSSNPTIFHSTIRYSMNAGIRLVQSSGIAGEVHNNNIYGNALYDIVADNDHPVNAWLNYWGTPNGPSLDLCSSAVVGGSVTYEAWLEEEFTESFRFISAGANPTSFEAVTEHTEISFSLNQPADWKLSILSHQFDQIWSASGSNSTGDSITWNGMGNYGVVSGTCYYRIEAHNNSGNASPAMGVLYPGNRNQAIAKISRPLSRSIFTLGAHVTVLGTAMLSGGTYDLYYAEGENPQTWETLVQSRVSNVENSLLYVWDTASLAGQPSTAYIKLLVYGGGITCSDISVISFYVDGPAPDNNTETIYNYDCMGRLKQVAYPSRDSGSIQYSYDRAGNRMNVFREGDDTPTLIKLSSFTARPTMKGIVLEWQTASETDTAGFNVFRKAAVETEFEKLNSVLIPAAGSPTEGAAYSFTDVPPGMRNWQYQLEEVEITGRTKRYGPVAPRNITLKNHHEEGVFRKSFRVKCD